MKQNLESHGVVVIIKKEDRFLLLEDSRELMLGFWGPPHGRCEATDNSEEEAVIREVFEETNLQVKPIKKLWTTEADTKVKTVSFWKAELVGGEIKIDSSESSKYGWFTVEEALNLKLYPGTKKFLELVKGNEIVLQ
jgi:8-oxo-dGTP pyrophosphatase MutT (NUDIX family)